MTDESRTALLALLRDIVTGLVSEATEVQLHAAYLALRDEPATPGPRNHLVRNPPTRPPPPRSGEYPAATIEVVRRHAPRMGGEFQLADITRAVQREQPAISKSAVSAALVRMAGQGELHREGERYSRYSVVPGRLAGAK